MKKRTTIAVIPDMQVEPGVSLAYCHAVGSYLAHKKADIIICGGDFWDMKSLNQYEKKGSKSMEGARYADDIEYGLMGMRKLMKPIKAVKGYKPKLIFLMGNHEHRIDRAIKEDPVSFEGVISTKDLKLSSFGWKVIPFLEVTKIEGIAFSHYFCGGIMGRPVTAAKQLITKKHMSCFAFHQQGRDIAYGKAADGRDITAIIAGSCYLHTTAYLNPQTDNFWRGLYILHNANNGSFDECAVPLSYIMEEYS